jgi:hypothetical protein
MLRHKALMCALVFASDYKRNVVIFDCLSAITTHFAQLTRVGVAEKGANVFTEINRETIRKLDLFT